MRLALYGFGLPVILLEFAGLLLLGAYYHRLPSDPRSQPWYDPLVFWIQIGISLLCLAAGVLRLLVRLRDRGT